ncbi:carboxymuconolactone decarboxylase family protein [Limibaculum sp. M0105]|uniref:Carboxymuconolactone decarboxylase family protein n=1 Tax=Thermohalobaculum xanthum TaxID=2753746 RepID=A0A8J7M760_9RHOB|nr:carboxymuconolactone decarboxylase family protein [Thermohalobaculum xanthum]MBK0399799.1 carboxymuconolactone decarboxylase family protein [Thermohalobaculum xanthum]
MSRINAVDPATAQGRARDLLDGVQKKLGITPNLMRVMANQPAVLDAYLKLNEALGQGGFDAKAREAVALAVAGANACDYCASAHSAISKGLKVEPAEIEARLAGRSSDPALSAALGFARRVVETRGFVSDVDLKAVRDAGHGDAEIVEVVALVAANILTNYINHVAQTAIDFPAVDASAHRVAA